MRLEEQQVNDELARLEGWKLEDAKWITKRYRFREYLQGIEFVGEIARAAEAQNHHPMIAIDYKLITVRLTTWSAAGLTLLDCAAASEYDRIYDSLL